MTILGGAALGAVVSIVTLVDRFVLSETDDAVTPAIVVTLPGDTLNTGDLTPVTDPSATTAKPTPETVPAPEPDLAATVRARLEETLALARCDGVEIRSLRAEGHATDKADSSSGFDGYFLKGNVTLAVADRMAQLPLAGTGKGPFARTGAVDMATEQFAEALVKQDITRDICSKD